MKAYYIDFQITDQLFFINVVLSLSLQAGASRQKLNDVHEQQIEQ